MLHVLWQWYSSWNSAFTIKVMTKHLLHIYYTAQNKEVKKWYRWPRTTKNCISRVGDRIIFMPKEQNTWIVCLPFITMGDIIKVKGCLSTKNSTENKFRNFCFDFWALNRVFNTDFQVYIHINKKLSHIELGSYNIIIIIIKAYCPRTQ